MSLASDTIVKTLMQRRAELIGYAWLVVGDADQAEDVFQEVSVAAIRKRDEIENAEHLIGWLYQAIRYEGMRARRANSKSHQLLSSEVLELLESVRSQADARAEPARLTALRECIGQLQGGVRQVLELRYGQNLKSAAIAERTGKKVQTIYKTITRAHAALRDCVRQRLATEGGAA